MVDQRKIRCSKCSKLLMVDSRPQEFRVKCPGCQAILRVPGSAGAAPVQRPGAVGNDATEMFEEPTLPTPVQRPGNQRAPRQPVAPADDWLTSSVPAARSAGSGNLRPLAMQKKSNAGRGGIPKIAIGVIACLVAIPLALGGIVGIRALSSKLAASRNAESKASVPPGPSPGSGTSAPSAVPSIAVAFPDLGPAQKTLSSGVVLHFVRLRGSPAIPGSRTSMQVYIPPGDHQPQSLPCILVAPAGTPMLHGAELLSSDDYHDETLPYAEAGMVVIKYSLDGHTPEPPGVSDEAQMILMSQSYPAFKAAGAGVENGKAATDYALAKLAMVDPKRIYSAGHSSAGNVSLLLAASDSRITRCVAYAAAYDFESRMGDAVDDSSVQQFFPGIKAFVQQTSPMNRISDLHCPVMVFHARDDNNVPYTDAETFVARMQQSGKDIKFVNANSGGHYSPMISEGIPNALTWLKNP